MTFVYIIRWFILIDFTCWISLIIESLLSGWWRFVHFVVTILQCFWLIENIYNNRHFVGLTSKLNQLYWVTSQKILQGNHHSSNCLILRIRKTISRNILRQIWSPQTFLRHDLCVILSLVIVLILQTFSKGFFLCFFLN